MPQNKEDRLISEAYSKIKEASAGDKRYNDLIKKLWAQEQAEKRQTEIEGKPPVKYAKMYKIPGQINFDIKKDPNLKAHVDPSEFDIIYMESPDGRVQDVNPNQVEELQLMGWRVINPKAPETQDEF